MSSMKLFIIAGALALAACGSNQTSQSNSPQTPVQSMICESPNVPLFTYVNAKAWIYFNGITYTPYNGGCIPKDR